MAKNDDEKNDGAKPDKDKDKKKGKVKNGKKKGGCLVPIVLFVLILGGVAAAIYFDLFGLKTKYLAPILRPISVFSFMFPSDEATEPEPQPKSANEWQAEIDDLTSKLDSAQTSLSQEQEKNKLYMDEITRLQPFEEQQVQFKDDKAAFDKMIAEKDPNAYIKFYEGISPENAADLYKEAVIAKNNSQELKNYVQTVESMDEKSAAQMLEQMISTNINLVVLILNSVSVETRGAIMGAMTAANAATVYTHMAPQNNE